MYICWGGRGEGEVGEYGKKKKKLCSYWWSKSKGTQDGRELKGRRTLN